MSPLVDLLAFRPQALTHGCRTMLFQLDRRILLLAGLLVMAGAGGAGYFWWTRQSALPGRDSVRYQEYQRAFQVGVAALDTGDQEKGRAQKNLERAIELIPGEPAAWANLGLFYLRHNNFTEAAKYLKRAQELAPDNDEIGELLGHLAERQGRPEDAVAYFRKAAAKHPNDLPKLYTLAEAVSRAGGAESGAEYQRLLEQILKLQPNNLPVLVQRVGAAHNNKDNAALRDTLDRLKNLSPEWAPISRDMLAKLDKAAQDTPRDLLHLKDLLNNVLQAERGYPRDKRALRPTADFVGAPLQRFLRLHPIRPTPAPADLALAFKLELQSANLPEKSRWDVLRPVWMLGAEQRTPLLKFGDKGGHRVWSAETFKLALFVANADEVRRTDIDASPLAFPSGAKKVAPSSAGVLAMDWNGDYLTDLLLAGGGGLRFWQQQLDGSFKDVSAKTGLPAEVLGGDYYGAWAADFEMDGDLDIVVARRSGPVLVLRNNGDGTFKTFDTFAAVHAARVFVWIDLDNDGAADAAFLDAKGSLQVFSNERYGLFSPWPLPENVGGFVGITGADVNDDGVFDLIGARSDGSVVRISDQDKKQSWQIAELVRGTPPAGAEPGAVTLAVEDLDNNCAFDLVVGGPSSAQVFLASENGTVAPLAATVDLRLSAAIDLHRDGRLDLVGLSPDGKPMRALNQSNKGYRWQTIWPLGNPNPDNRDGRINSFAVGGEVEIRCGPLVQKQPANGGPIHFGLGDQPAVDVARIVWPNGVPQWEFDMPAFRLFGAIQRLYASCPFLFTYDGAGMRFAGDFMWGTPLGMYINGQNIGDFPQTTEWLKIPGQHLVPRDGYYDVRVQANLWEADYFDQLALIVVDHPVNTEIHVDERYFLTPTPPRLHVTTPTKPVASAWDHHGRDATDEVRELDGRYLDRARRGRFQGVTEDHWVEIDLGDNAPREGPVLLVARGWLQPTNCSINVALAQGKNDLPQPLSLEVPDGKGGWKVALPALGFPAGKDKTMLIRLDNLGEPNGLGEPGGVSPRSVTRRFRLRTSMEIYWDFLGYATELDPKLARLERPTPMSAELRYRGILEMTRKNRSSPEVPLYDKVSRGGQAWRDLAGYYTRFGEVADLLAKVDDRYVIMNAGDEIALRFPAPKGPSPGWKRDFIWECDGWTRDGDLNTRHGNSVLPLPAHGVKTDDCAPVRLQDDPVYRRYARDWQTYHTRYVRGDEFARGLRSFRR